MERTGELATLPFTYTAGTIGRSGWGGGAGTGPLCLGPGCLGTGSWRLSLDPWNEGWMLGIWDRRLDLEAGDSFWN